MTTCQWARRKRYAIKQRENKQQQPKEEPKQPIEQPTEQPKLFAVPRGGERKPSNCIPLTEIEASHTSDAYRKVSEKAHRRFGKDRW